MDDIEIDSIQTYDFRRARLSVDLRWMLAAAYGANIPKELREPLPLKDKDTVMAIYVNTGIVSLLVNSRLYIQACHNLFPQLSTAWQAGGHWSVIQGLSGALGVYVVDDNAQPITELELLHTTPFHLTAHVSLIEAIMTAYTQTTAATDRIVQSIKAIGSFNASEDLPIDCEDGLLVWMNKVSAACVKHAHIARQQQLTNNNSPTVRVNKKHLSEVGYSSIPSAQLMDDILKDISDGCSLCILISFYCPNHLNFSDIQLTQPVGIGDSLHNISLVKAFCDTHLPVRIFHFTHEDILYTTDSIKVSLLAFLAQLFQYFVVEPLDIVCPPARISTNNNHHTQNQGSARAIPSSVAAGSSLKQSTTASPQHVNRPQDLISSATKRSFTSPAAASPSVSRLSNNSEHYGSNPSLNNSTASAGTSRLLNRRSTQATDVNVDNGSMHDTLSPIVVRKSQSVGILNVPDPKQSLVAWESKSYFVDRSKAKPANRTSTTSNGSTSLLSNVSFHEDEDDVGDGPSPPPPPTSSDISHSISSAKDLQRRQNRANTRTVTPDRTRSNGSQMSNSYQKLLDRSSDLESPLKLFAQKHGFQLASKSETANSTGGGDQSKSTSPVDLTCSEFTKITPRSDSETSPRHHVSTESRNGTPIGQSYVISTALTPDGAQAAGLPIIDDPVSDSCTDITFTSLADNEDCEEDNGRRSSGSPIQPIIITESNEEARHLGDIRTDEPVTSFVHIGMSHPPSTELSHDVSMTSAPSHGGLKQRFEQQKNLPPEAKSSKKTTFSLNQTTWSDHARGTTNSEADSDSMSETSEASGDRKPSDVKILLGEKRKAMEKKKTLEDLERTKEMNTASRQAFLKAVSKNKSHPNHDNRSSESLKAFSRDDISKNIESLQSKWKQEEKDNAKRVAATVTSAKNINITPASLDYIAEVSESSEVETPKVPLPSGSLVEAAKTLESKERRISSADMHEAPVDVEQYGLEKLNASLSELRGEMKRLTEEQQRIEELQSVIKTPQPQSRSTPLAKNPSSKDTRAPIHNQLNSPITDHTLRLSDLDKSSPDNPQLLPQADAMTSSDYSTSLNRTKFSQPNIQSMSQSTDEPFILHDTQSTTSSTSMTSSDKKKSKPGESSVSGKSSPSRKSSTSASTLRSSSTGQASPNAFLSSSQLSRKRASVNNSTDKAPAQPSPASPDQSAGRRRWTANTSPLFPGYEDDDSQAKSMVSLREPEMATQDQQPVFQPPADTESVTLRKASHRTRRSLNKPQQSSPPDTPMRDARRRPSSDALHIQELPGHRLPANLNGTMSHAYISQDTPMRMTQNSGADMQTREVGLSSTENILLDGELDTPLRDFYYGGVEQGLVNNQPSLNVSLDTPMRQGYPQYEMSHGYNISMSESPQGANISGVIPIAATPCEPTFYHHNPNDIPVAMGTHGQRMNNSIGTPLRQAHHQPGQRQQAVYDDSLDTPMRQRLPGNDRNMRDNRRPQSMYESHLNNTSIDTPMKDAMKKSSNQIFYSPPTRHRSESIDQRVQSPYSGANSFTDTPMSLSHAVSRHGTVSSTPHAVSRHGTVTADHPLDSSSGGNRLVKGPYEFEPEPEKPITGGTYKLSTPYGTADNEAKPAETSISLSSAMDAIRNDMIRQQNTEPNNNLAFSAITPTHSEYNQPAQTPTGLEYQTPPTSYAVPAAHGLPMSRRVSSASSDMESAFADIGSTHSQYAPANAGSSIANMPGLARQTSADDDRASVHSHGSGSAESADGTPRSGGRPKRATWDMSTPRGDLLNQPGVGFIVAEQTQLSEEELRKRKEKVLMMQLRRKEEQELKKQQKAAELAAKAEMARMKEQEAERKKLEEKVKKEAILQQFQIRKAEEDLPPEMRAQFRQKQKRPTERPASIHWAGSSADENTLRGFDNLDSAASFTVSLASGNFTHRRPISPATSSTAGSLSSRSKAPSRSAIEAPSDEYTGPKLYVKPSQKQKSNRTIIINAVSHCCLAGVVNTDNKNNVLEEIARSDGKHFLILFRDGNQTYKAVYSYCPDSGDCMKIHGQGPKHIKDDMCHRFYKYNSGGKKFTEVLSTKHLSVSIDAITIHNHLWQRKPAPSSRR